MEVKTLRIAILMVMLVHGFAAGALSQDVREAIVKIYAVKNAPDYYMPWSMQGPRSSTGSGAIIEGNRILTNAHVVSDNTFLQVRRYGETQRYLARILAISHDSDLALITVDHPGFFDDVEPLSFGELPEAQQEVRVYGFPMGGDTLSITSGVISRIEHQPYVHASAHLLAAQIDAAINPGNSGGPAIVDEEIVGVIMQGIPQAQNIGYMVPIPIIKHFLDGLEQGPYRGFPSLGIMTQRMDSRHMREYYQMAPDQSGVLITNTFPGSPADGRILPQDVVLSIAGYPIANDATVEFRPKERTHLAYAVQKHQIGSTISVELLRDGQVRKLDIVLDKAQGDNLLVPLEVFETQPTYFIYGGIVFTPLNRNVLSIWGHNWFDTAPTELVHILRNNVPAFPNQEVIFILRTLPADVNDGYQDTSFWVVDKVNGHEITDMKDFVRRIEQSEEAYTIIENTRGQQIILDRREVERTHQQVLATYQVPADRSADLQ